MEFKPLTFDDLKSVMILERSLPNSLSWEPASEKNQSSIIQKGDNFGVFENNMLIGKVGFWDTKTEGWEVDGMIIDKKYRGKNIGTKLFDYALKTITEKVHPSQLVLFTYPENATAISIYLRAGFVIREWISDKYGPGKHRLKMTKKVL